MRYAVCAMTIMLSLAVARPAAGWDPDADQASEPAPPAWTPERAPIVPPPGIYLVTETYAGDSITQAGAVTTYSTETVHETTGSYARVLETVGTGGSSAYDGSAFNGRAALADGRAVAGTYYENYVWTDAGFVAVSVVFFQDDSEIARARAVAEPQTPAPARSATRLPFDAASRLEPPPAPLLVPSATGIVAPIIDDDDDLVPAAPATSSPARLADRSVEVLRGRRSSLSFTGADIRGWRFMSGECVALGPLSGTAADPFVVRWDRLAPTGTAWIVRFLLERVDGTSQQLVVRVAVRAPGLVE